MDPQGQRRRRSSVPSGSSSQPRTVVPSAAVTETSSQPARQRADSGPGCAAPGPTGRRCRPRSPNRDRRRSCGPRRASCRRGCSTAAVTLRRRSVVGVPAGRVDGVERRVAAFVDGDVDRAVVGGERHGVGQASQSAATEPAAPAVRSTSQRHRRGTAPRSRRSRGRRRPGLPSGDRHCPGEPVEIVVAPAPRSDRIRGRRTPTTAAADPARLGLGPVDHRGPAVVAQRRGPRPDGAAARRGDVARTRPAAGARSPRSSRVAARSTDSSRTSVAPRSWSQNRTG